MFHYSNNKKIQISLAIRGGYIPDKLQTANTETTI